MVLCNKIYEIRYCIVLRTLRYYLYLSLILHKKKENAVPKFTLLHILSPPVHFSLCICPCIHVVDLLSNKSNTMLYICSPKCLPYPWPLTNRTRTHTHTIRPQHILHCGRARLCFDELCVACGTRPVVRWIFHSHHARNRDCACMRIKSRPLNRASIDYAPFLWMDAKVFNYHCADSTPNTKRIHFHTKRIILYHNGKNHPPICRPHMLLTADY